MKVGVFTSTVIERPVEEVAAFASDPGNVPAWYENTVKGSQLIERRENQEQPRVAVVAGYF